ncbi:MAG: helix-turn-helix transcriptional regulator [Flavobacteriales bacterium]|nr:helix-turn-helix transcriptional regulator [Flavobacteriales bacterium]
MIHIGKKVKEVIDAKGISVTLFAKKINKSRSVVYDIFERESIDSFLLYKISEELDFNFFELFELNNPENIVAEPPAFYGDGWKIKYMDLLEKYNKLLETKVEVYFKEKA